MTSTLVTYALTAALIGLAVFSLGYVCGTLAEQYRQDKKRKGFIVG